MSDTLKDAAIAVFSIALISGFLQERAEYAVRHDLQKTFHNGQIHVSVKPRGLLGLLIGQSSVTSISGSDINAKDIPYHITRGGGLRSSVQRLELDFQNLTLRSLAIKQFTAVIPNVNLDGGRALFEGNIFIRSAGEGTAEAVVDADGLRRFLEIKYPQYRNIRVQLTNGAICVGADVTLFGATFRLEVKGAVVVKNERHADLTEPIVWINGKEADKDVANKLVAALNPVLDIDTDLDLGDFLSLSDIILQDGTATIRARATIPLLLKN